MKPTKIYVVCKIHEQMFDILTAFTSYKKAKDHVKSLQASGMGGWSYSVVAIMLNEQWEP